MPLPHTGSPDNAHGRNPLKRYLLTICGIGVLFFIITLSVFESIATTPILGPYGIPGLSLPVYNEDANAKRQVKPYTPPPPPKGFVQGEVKYKKLHGFVDALSVDKAHGWACYPTIDQPATIRIFDDTRKVVVGEFLADKERADVATVGVCTGAYHGWMFYFEDPWSRGKHDLSLYVMFENNGTNIVVLMGTKNITTLAPPSDVISLQSKSRFTTRVSWHNFSDEAYEVSLNGRVNDISRTNDYKFIVDHEADTVNFALVRAIQQYDKHKEVSLWSPTLKSFPTVYNSEASFFPQFAHNSHSSNLKGKKVLIWTHNLHLEGAPICAYQLAVYLKHRAVDITIQAGGNGTLFGYLRAHNINVVFGFNVRNQERYDIIILNTVTASRVLENRPELWPKSVWWIHEQETKLFQFFNMNLLTSVALAVFPTRGCADTYKEWDVGQFVVVPNGIDLARRDRIKSSKTREGFRKALKIKPFEFVITLHGTFAPNKGQLNFLEVANKLKEEKIKYLIVGASEQGDYLKQMLDYTNKNKLSKVMMFFKNPFVDLFYGSTDLHISNTQETESFGLTLIEAMSFGVPVVAPNLQGMSAIVQHNKTGYLFPPRTTDALVEYILLLKNNPSIAARIGQAGKDWVEKTHTLDFVMRKYEEALDGTFSK